MSTRNNLSDAFRALVNVVIKKVTLFLIACLPIFAMAQGGDMCIKIYQKDLEAYLLIQKINESYDPHIDRLVRRRQSAGLSAFGGTASIGEGGAASQEATKEIVGRIEKLRVERDEKIDQITYEREVLRYENSSCFE